LEAHRRPHDKDANAHALLVGALRQSLLCSLLEESDFEDLAATMEYYVFSTGQCVMKEGAVGSSFFVADSEGLELFIQCKPVASLSKGCSFGEFSVLLQKWPRTVSVVATRADVGVWATDSRILRRVVQASIVQQLGENRTFLGSVKVLEGLTSRQLDAVCDASTVHSYEVGEIPVRRGEQANCFFLVKSGELQVLAGLESWVKGEDVPSRLGRGACICERALQYNEPLSMTVEVTKRCELLRVNLSSLRQVLGGELNPICLQQGLLLSSLQKSGFFQGWSQPQFLATVQAMELHEYAPGAVLTRSVAFFVVLDRTVQVGGGASARVLQHGQYYGCKAALRTPESNPRPSASGARAVQAELLAGHRGCRLAVLPVPAMDSLLAWSGPDPEHHREGTVKLLSSVGAFRHLSSFQIDALASGATRCTYARGECIVRQGERVSKFFVAASGDLSVAADGRELRKLALPTCFGARAVMLDEPFRVTVQVSSAEATVCILDQDALMKVVRERTQTAEQLEHRAWLEDPGVGLADLEQLGAIGFGASGVVHLVRHKSSGFRYALKKISKVDGKVPRQVSREIEVLTECDHPFVIHLVRTLETDKSVYIITEYAGGGELHAAIRTLSTSLSKSQAVFYTGLIMLMLEYLNNRNIVYRDLKPENVMLDDRGYLKLIDFGTSRKLESSCPRAFTMVGTTHYMAPEIMRSKGYGTEVDKWGLGVVLYELVCNRLPFGDEFTNAADICKAILTADLCFPPEMDKPTCSIIQGLLDKRPQKRLGCGLRGYDEIKKASFFNVRDLEDSTLASTFPDSPKDARIDGSLNNCLFERLYRQDLQAPIAPRLQNLQDLDGSDERLSDMQAAEEDEACVLGQRSKEVPAVTEQEDEGFGGHGMKQTDEPEAEGDPEPEPQS